MILTCPNCNSQFKVGLAVFGREGRNVRCSACGEVWWQEPSLEDVTDEIAQEVKQDIYEPEESDINQVVEDDISDEELERITKERVDEYEKEQARRRANYVAAGLFIIIFAYLLLASGSIMKAHPEMQLIYRFFGINMELPDTFSLMFEEVKAEREGSSVTASGRIVNLSAREWDLPMMEIVVFKPVVEGGEGGKQEEVIAKWVESPPEPVLGAEMETQFSYSRHVSFDEKTHEHEGGGEGEEKEDEMLMVRVRFIAHPQPVEAVQEAEETEEHAQEEDTHGDAAAAHHDTGHEEHNDGHK